MIFYFLLFFVIILLSITTEDKVGNEIFFYLTAVALILIAGFRGDYVDRDYLTYVSYLYDFDELHLIQLEPTFFVIGGISLSTSHPILVFFLIYAIIGISIKAIAIKKLTEFWFYTLAIYFCYYFLIHEMTQIRVGVASGILLLAIPDIFHRRKFSFIVKVAIGSLFHYSMLIFIPFYFLNGKQFNKFFYIAIIIFAYLFYFSRINVLTPLSYLPIPFIQTKITAYSMLMEADRHVDINVFNILMILRIVYLLFLVFKIEVLQCKNLYSMILVKIYSWSLFSLVFFATMPVMAFRINQLLCIVEIILWPFMIYLIKEKYLAIGLLFAVALGMLSIELFYNNLISSYFKF